MLNKINQEHHKDKKAFEKVLSRLNRQLEQVYLDSKSSDKTNLYSTSVQQTKLQTILMKSNQEKDQELEKLKRKVERLTRENINLK